MARIGTRRRPYTRSCNALNIVNLDGHIDILNQLVVGDLNRSYGYTLANLLDLRVGDTRKLGNAIANLCLCHTCLQCYANLIACIERRSLIQRIIIDYNRIIRSSCSLGHNDQVIISIVATINISQNYALEYIIAIGIINSRVRGHRRDQFGDSYDRRSRLFLLSRCRGEGLNLAIGGLLALHSVCTVLVGALLNQLGNLNRERLGNSRRCNLSVVSHAIHSVLNTNLSGSLGYARVRTCKGCAGCGHVGSLARNNGQHLNGNLSCTKLNIIQTVGIRLTGVAECNSQSLLRSVLGRQVERVRGPGVHRVDSLVGIGVRLNNLPSCRSNIARKVLRRYNLELRVILGLEVPRQIEGQLLALGISYVELGHHSVGYNLRHRRAVRSYVDIFRAVAVSLTKPAQISICGPASVGRSEGPLAAGVNLIVLDCCKVISKVGDCYVCILLGCEGLHVTLILLAVNHYVSIVLVVGAVVQGVERDREGRLDCQSLLNGVVSRALSLVSDASLRDRAIELVATANGCTTHRDVGCLGSLNHGNRLDLHSLVLGREGQVVDTELLLSNLRNELQANDALVLSNGERCGGNLPTITGVASQRQRLVGRTAVGGIVCLELRSVICAVNTQTHRQVDILSVAHVDVVHNEYNIGLVTECVVATRCTSVALRSVRLTEVEGSARIGCTCATQTLTNETASSLECVELSICRQNNTVERLVVELGTLNGRIAWFGRILTLATCCQVNLLTTSTGCQVDIVNAGCDACVHLDIEILSSLLQRKIGRRLIPRAIIRAGVGDRSPLHAISTQRNLKLSRVERSIVVAVLVTLNTPLHMQILLAIESDLVDSERATCCEIEVIDTRRLVLGVVRVVVLGVVRGRVATNGYALRIVGNLGSTRTLLVEFLELVSVGPLVVRILRRSLAIEVVSEDNLGVSLLTLLLDVDRTLEQNGRNDDLGLTSRACITAHGYGQRVVAITLVGINHTPIGVARHSCPRTIATYSESLAALRCIELQGERFESLARQFLGDLQLRNNRIDLLGVTPCERHRDEQHRQSEKQMLQMFHNSFVFS